MTGTAWYSVIVTGVIVAGGTYFAALHVIKVVRWVTAAIAEARDNAITEAPDPRELTLEDCFEEESDDTAADILLWENELDADPAIRKYSRRMDRRSL